MRRRCMLRVRLQKMDKVQPVKAVILVLFRPARFVALAVIHDTALSFETNQQLLAKYPSRQLPSEEIKEVEKVVWERTKKIRGALFAAFGSTTIAILVGVLAGYSAGCAFGKPSAILLSTLQILGAAVILIATLALLGWDIQSWKGRSLSEQVNRWLFRVQYWFGTTLFVFSLAWTG